MSEDLTRATAYTTVAADTDVETEIRRSRFLARLRRVTTEEDARAFITQARRDHHDARHHCSAFVLGADRETQRSSDDGEPSGTAGVPMLEALTLAEVDGRRDLSDVVVVVTRWFGGIKLGAGGLVRAYSDAVSGAVAAAPLVRRERLQVLALAVPVADVGREESVLRAAGETVVETTWGADGASVHLALPDVDGQLAAAQARLNGLLARETVLTRQEVRWVDVPLG